MPNFDFADECKAIRTEIKDVGEGVHALGLGLARVETRLTAHEDRHNRDDSTAALRRAKDSTAPAKQRSVDMSAIAKIAAGIGIAVAMGLSAWTFGTSASAEDVKAAVRTGSAVIIEAAADVASERAKAVIETEGVATGEEIQELTEVLRALMDPRPVTAPPEAGEE